jgi:colanic acid biosynthesis glycosyl transferase WcaI
VKKTEITFIGLNFAPEDSAIGLYSSEWVNQLESDGHNVTVVTGFPYYPQWSVFKQYKNKPRFLQEYIGGTKILRYRQYVPKAPTFFKRIVHIIDFTVGSLFNLFKIKKCDLVIAVVPFTTSAFLGWIQKKRFNSKFWIHIQDFELDAALQSKKEPKVGPAFSLMFRLESWLFRKPDIVSTISHSMIDTLRKKSNSSSFYLPNWVNPDAINPATANFHRYINSSKIVLLYSGNIGEKQDWNSFVEFCNDINQNNYEIIIVGDGSKKNWLLERTVHLPNIKHYPPVPYSELSDLLCSVDIHLLFQKPDFLDLVMPSKVLGMMASAKPSLIIGHRESEINSVFKSNNIGLYFDRYSKEVVIELDKISKQNSQMKEMGENARVYVIKNFSKDRILKQVQKKIELL